MLLLHRFIRFAVNPILARNKKFLNLHQGEKCYIIGNGASIKYLDLRNYDDHVAIGINLLCIHNDYKKLNIKYHICIEPFFFYPLIRNFYDGRRFQKNILWSLFKKSFFRNKNVMLFTSITNILSCKVKNVFYLHHFGVKKAKRMHLRIDGNFSFMEGALHSAIGLAIEMGFKEAILIGCDYLLSPKKSGHFYSLGPPTIFDEGLRDDSFKDLCREVSSLIKLSMIVNEGKSDLISCNFPNNSKSLEYRENYQIVADEYLKILDEAYKKNQFKSLIFQALR